MNIRWRSVLPWLICLFLLALLLLLIGVGWWRGTGTGPQVQVPMFYDAHYLFPRPWTQEQAAPGVPDLAPLAFYGQNQVSQSFFAAADNLALIELWLAGPQDTAVTATLITNNTSYSAQIPLSHGSSGGKYFLSFPPFTNAGGQQFRLTLSAPEATAVSPVVAQTVGGDRLGSSWQLNEYQRPGNLAMQTYIDGRFDQSWLKAIGEQLFPAQFRLRVQQYKPLPFKGAFFPLLLIVTAVFSLIFLLLASPNKTHSLHELQLVLGWGIATVLFLFLAWQIGSGRLRLPFFASVITLQPTDSTPVQADLATERLINDFTATLWTAEREPEARFVSTDVIAGLPVIQVPAESALRFPLTVPRNGRFRTGFAAQGDGSLVGVIRIGDEIVAQEEVNGVANPASAITWFDLDLSPWAGKGIELSLESKPLVEASNGLWFMPQLSAQVDWLLPDPLPAKIAVQEGRHRFNGAVEVAGFTVEAGDVPEVNITIYWRSLQQIANQAVVFIHVLDATGQLIAQRDTQPVDGTYPVSNWQPGTIIVDQHTIPLPQNAVGPFTIVIGLYDPLTLARWPVVDADGISINDGRVVLEDSLVINP